MPMLSAGEIYRVAVLAGFTPDQAVTMTAIALAESSGNSLAHNPTGEDSRGLWQINFAVHPEFAGQDLYDPLTNARAAYEVSLHGGDISPWTTAHGVGDAMYLEFRDEAELAAMMAGDTAVGNWIGVEGYGHPAPAAGSGALPTTPGLAGPNPALETFLNAAEAQVGDPYIWGIGADVANADPAAFDCSELSRWAAGRAGYDLQDGSWLQYLQLQQEGMLIPVEQAINTPGALLFRFSSEPTPNSGRPDSAHVAISLGDGQTVEASDPSVGVIYGDAHNGFNYAAVLPGISDGTVGPPGAGALTAAGGGVDTDADGVTDLLEIQLRLDPTAADTDADGLTDGFELLRSKTSASAADTDRDRLSDSVEISTGSDAGNPDSNRDGIADGEVGTSVDTDRDELSDALETILGTGAATADSDRDGFTDGAEYLAGYDPVRADSSPLAQLGTSGPLDADPDLPS